MTSGEFTADNVSLGDIRQMMEVGLPHFISEVGDPDVALLRLRTAYDAAWQHVYDGSFGTENATATQDTNPTIIIKRIFDNLWRLRERPAERSFTEFAFAGNWTRGETNEIALLFADNEQYTHETRFVEELEVLCERVDLAHTPHITAQLLKNYAAAMYITWMFDESVGIEEANQGVENILLGKAD